jgi:hypothetical protein
MNIDKAALAYWDSDAQQGYKAPCTPQQINAIEQLVSKKLPPDFVSFLTQYAGVDTGIGTIDDPIGFVVAQVVNGSRFFAGLEASEYSTGISTFATADEMIKTYTILTGDSPHFDAGPRIPDHMLPINTENEMLLIDLSDEDYGKIWLWYAIEETWGSEQNNTMDFVANSFTEFVESLTSLAAAEKRIFLRLEVLYNI